MKNIRIYTLFGVISIILTLCIHFFYRLDNSFVLTQHSYLAHEATNAKIEHPFIPVKKDINHVVEALQFHFINREFRLTIPILANILSIKSEAIVQYQLFFLPIFIFLLLLFLYRRLLSVSYSLLITGTFIGNYVSICFIQQFPFFDAYSLLIIALLLNCRNKYVNFLILIVGFFIDERLLISSGLIILLNIYLEFHKITFKSILTYIILHPYFYYSWIIYFLLRSLLIIKYNFYSVPATYLFFSTSSVISNIKGCILSFLYIYKVWGIILVFNLYVFIKKGEFKLYIIFLFIMLFMVSSGIFVYDFSRIHLYFLPFIFLNILLFYDSIENKGYKLYITGIIFLITFITPSKIIHGGFENKIQDIYTIWNK